MHDKIAVLDHGYVQLCYAAGTDDNMLEAARMSTGNPTGVDTAKDDQTRDYLWRHGHSSPFEMAWACVEIQVPIFVARQIMRHRLFSFNEHSARYAEMPDLFYLPNDDRIQGQGTVNKQGSSGKVDVSEIVRYTMQEEQKDATRDYRAKLAYGVARETARINLPVSQYTRLRMAGNARLWFDFLSKRLPENAQWETRQFAEAIARAVKGLWPKTWALFEEYTLGGVKLSRSQWEIIREMLESPEAHRTVEYMAKRTMKPGPTRELLGLLGSP